MQRANASQLSQGTKSVATYSALFALVLFTVVSCGSFTERDRADMLEGVEVLPWSSTQPVGPTGRWTLSFEDNFDGTALDTHKWSIGYGWERYTNWTRDYAADEMVSVNDGILRLGIGERTTQTSLGERQYVSGTINTKNKFYQEYGYWEARIKMIGGKGLHSAFWAKPNDESWPPEIDFVEVMGEYLWDAVQTIHYDEGKGPKHTQIKNPMNSGSTTGGLINWTEEFHVYGAKWTPDKVTFYIDGIKTGTIARSEGAGYQRKPFYIMLSIHVGNYWVGYPDANTDWTKTMEVDWVRVWKRSCVPTQGEQMAEVQEKLIP